MAPTLYMITGLPGSGKSTAVKRFMALLPHAFQARSFSSDDGSSTCFWLHSFDGSVAVLGRYIGLSKVPTPSTGRTGVGAEAGRAG